MRKFTKWAKSSRRVSRKRATTKRPARTTVRRRATYKARLYRTPRLANNYVAIRSAFTYPFATTNNMFPVYYNSTGMDAISYLDLSFTAVNFLSLGEAAKHMWNCYQMVRFRSCKIVLTPNVSNGSGVARTDVVLYTPQDRNVANNPGSFSELMELRGRRLLRNRGAKAITFNFVPQVDIDGAVDSSNGNPPNQILTNKPAMCPWLATTDAMQLVGLKSPLVFFRRPYGQSEVAALLYHVRVECILEFKDGSRERP